MSTIGQTAVTAAFVGTGVFTMASMATMTEQGNVSMLTGRVRTASVAAPLVGGIWRDAGGVPGNLIAYTTTFTLPGDNVPAWRDLAFNDVVPLSPGNYWIGYAINDVTNTASNLIFSYNGSGTNAMAFYGGQITDQADGWVNYGFVGSSTGPLGCYATYIAGPPPTRGSNLILTTQAGVKV